MVGESEAKRILSNSIKYVRIVDHMVIIVYDGINKTTIFIGGYKNEEVE